MLITCPSCQTEYNVPDETLAGRVVRCARCATEWTPVPAPAVTVEEEVPPPPSPPVPPAPEPPAPPPPIVVPQREAPVARSAPPQPALFAWAASVVVIVAAVAGAYVWRTNVMQAWPPSQRAYQALGLH